MKKLLTVLIILTLSGGCANLDSGSRVSGPDLKGELDRAIESQPDEQNNKPKVRVPDSLNQELLALPNLDTNLKFDVSANQVESQQFFIDLMDATGENIIIEPGVTEPITLNLKAVTLTDVLTALRDMYNLDYEKTSYGYRVMADRLNTKVFHINYLNIVRKGTSDTGITGSQISAQGQQSSQVSTTTESDFWAQLEQTLNMLVGDKPGRSIMVNRQAGIVLAQANSSELRSIENYLQISELAMQQQVIIEARILEVNLSDGFQSGINWGQVVENLGGNANDIATLAFSGNNLNGVTDVGGVFNLSVNADNFSGMIQLLSSQGDIQVLSSPRISTVNNQKAVIKVGTDDFFVTNITQSEDEDGNAESPEIELQPFFSGIALDVTPQIGQNDEIILHVRPSVTEVQEKTKVINLGNDTYELPLASSSIRETDSIIRAQSGQIVVIGGLLQNSENSQDAGIPLLSRVPIVKGLFAQTRRENSKSELVILLQPTITNTQVWRDELSKYKSQLQP